MLVVVPIEFAVTMLDNIKHYYVRKRVRLNTLMKSHFGQRFFTAPQFSEQSAINMCFVKMEKG